MNVLSTNISKLWYNGIINHLKATLRYLIEADACSYVSFIFIKKTQEIKATFATTFDYKLSCAGFSYFSVTTYVMLINCTLSIESGAIVLTLVVSLSTLISTDMALLFVVGSSFDYLFPVDYGGIASTIIHLNSVVYVVVVPSSPLII